MNRLTFVLPRQRPRFCRRIEFLRQLFAPSAVIQLVLINEEDHEVNPVSRRFRLDVPSELKTFVETVNLLRKQLDVPSHFKIAVRLCKRKRGEA